MNKTTIFVIRLVLAVFLSFVLVRLFRPEIHPASIVVLAAFMLGTAYALEYLKNKRSSEKEKHRH